MTNKERLLQDGSNCPFRKFGKFDCDCDENWLPEDCRPDMVKRLSRTAKGRRWLDDDYKEKNDELCSI